MTRNTPVEGIDPVAEVEMPNLPGRARAIHPGLVIRVRGRFVRLRGLRRQPAGVLRWLAVLGPGLVAGAVSNDAGSIATYSQAGAKFGYDMLWTVSYTHLRAHETRHDLVCRLLLEKKK